MKLQLHCFGCKVKVDVDVDAEDIEQLRTKERYKVRVSCPECERSITSLISKTTCQQIFEEDVRSKENSELTTTHSD